MKTENSSTEYFSARNNKTEELKLDKDKDIVCQTCGLKVPLSALSNTCSPKLVTKCFSLKKSLDYATRHNGSFRPEFIDIEPYYIIEKCKRCEKKEISTNKFKKETLLRESNMSSAHKTKDFSNYLVYSEYQKKLLPLFKIAKCEGSAYPPIIILTGETGTGKTHIGTALLKECINKYKNGYYALLDDIYSMLRASNNPKNNLVEMDLINSYINKYILILDEFDLVKNTEYTNPKLFKIINSRIDKNKTTIIISNLALEIFKSNLSAKFPALHSRIFQTNELAGDINLCIDCCWRDFRLMKNIQTGSYPCLSELG